MLAAAGLAVALDAPIEGVIMMARRWCPSFYNAFLQIWRKRATNSISLRR